MHARHHSSARRAFFSFLGIVVAWNGLTLAKEEAAESVVGVPKLVFVGIDAQGGNGDVWLEPGETVNVRIELANEGDALATSVFGTLDYLGTHPGVTILDKTSAWPNLVAKGAPQFTSSPHFQVALDSSLACAARLPFRVSVSTGTGHVFDLDFTLRVGEKRDFDSLNVPGVPRVNEQEVTFGGAVAADTLGFAVAWADRNGDGLADPFLGAPNAGGGAGQVWVRSGFAAPFLMSSGDVNLVKGSPWSMFFGTDAGDAAGRSIAACDVNADGFEDVLIGAPNGDSVADGLADAGEVYLVYGSGAFGVSTSLEPPHASIAHFWGDDLGDNLGTVGCGDINGDGFDDLLLGAGNADSVAEARASAGEVYLVYGRSTIWPDTDLAVVTPGVVRFFGATAGDLLGEAIGTGDVNGDGFDDMIFGVRGGDSIGETRNGAGEAYVVYGRANNWTNTDLNTSPAGVVRFFGADVSDALGTSVASGDVDGDGFDDIVIGAVTADSVGNTRADAGELTVVFGRATPWTDTDLANPPAGVSRIFGPDAGDLFGLVVEAGDLDGDGYAEVVAGSIVADSAGNARGDAGEVAIVYGGSARYGDVDLLAAPGLVSRFYGREASDQMGRSVSIGDTNGDGYGDLLVGAWLGDATANLKLTAGDAYVLYGKPTDSFHGRPDTFAFIDASGGTNLNLACDDCSVEVPMGFSFPFYGDEHTSVYVGSNGLLSFAPIEDLPSAHPLCTPARNPSNALIAPFWDDLNPEAGGVGSGVFALLQGIAPNRRLTIEWKDIPHYPAIGAATFEVTLFESTGDILFQYADTIFGDVALDSGAAAVAGVENRKGANGYAWSCFSGTALSSGTAARLSPTAPLLDSRHPSFLGTPMGLDPLWTFSSGSFCEPNEHTVDVTSSFYYGQAGSCTYDTGVANAGSLRFATIPDFPADARSSHWLRRQTDGGVATDLSTIQVSTTGIGGPYVDAAQDTDNSNSWKHSGTQNLFGFGGASADVRWRFDTVDAVGNAFLGWMVDDFQVFGCDATGVVLGAAALAFASPPLYCEQTAGRMDSVGSLCGDGGAPTSFQWRENGAPIPGANQVAYTIPASQPPGDYEYAVDITCGGGGSDSSLPADVEIVAKPGVGSSVVLAKVGGGTSLHLTWADVASAEDYVVFQDTSAAGAFATEAGTSPGGGTGLTVPTPAGTVFYLVSGRNDVCGLGPKN